MAATATLVAWSAEAIEYNYSTISRTVDLQAGLLVALVSMEDQNPRDATFNGAAVTPYSADLDVSRPAAIYVIEVLAGRHTFTVSYNYNKYAGIALWNVVGAVATPKSFYNTKYPGYPNEDTPIVGSPLTFASGGIGLTTMFAPGGGNEDGGNTTWFSPAVERFDSVFANQSNAYYSGATLPSATTPRFSGHRFSGPRIMGIAFDPAAQGTTATAASTLAGITASAGGSNALRASGARTLGSMVAQAAGKALLVAAGAATLQPIIATAPSRLGVSGTGATTLGEVAGAASATRTPVLSASTFATLAPIASAATAQTAIVGAASSTLGQINASGVGAAAIVAVAASTAGAIEGVSTGQAQVAAVAANQLGAIVGAAQAGAQISLVANAASVLADLAATSSSQALISAAGSVGLNAVIGSSSAAAAPVRAAAATAIGEIAGTSVGRLGVSAVGSAQIAPLGSVAATHVVVRAVVSAALAPISGVGRGHGDDTGLGGDPSPGWVARVAPRRFTGSAARRRFTALSTGCTRMITYPAKSAREVRHASVDFRPDLASGETLVGTPTVTVARGTVGVTAKRIEGTEVRFTLSGGSTSPTAIQRLEVSCSTSAGQVLEETVSMTIRSDA